MSEKLIDKFVGKTIEEFVGAGYDDEVGNFGIKFTDGTYVEFGSCGCCGGIWMDVDAVLAKKRNAQTVEELRKRVEAEEAEAAEQRSRGLIA